MAVGNLEFIKTATSGSGVSNFSLTDCFSDSYDVYYLSITKYNTNSQNYQRLRFLDSGGSVISANEYDYAFLRMESHTGYTEVRQTGISSIPFINTSTGAARAMGTGFYIHNPYDSSSYTFTQFQGTARSSAEVEGSKGIGVHKSAEQITGVNVFPTTGSIYNVQLTMFGVK